MWYVKYGDQYLHDPRVSVFITDTSLSPEVNTSGEFKFTITKKHSLYETLREHDMDNEVTVYDDDDLIFCGTIVEIDKDFQLTADVTCQGEMSYLNKSLIPPFSTLSTESGEIAPDNLAGFFEWLIEKHNSQVDARRQFVVGRNDGSSIVEGTFYLSNDSYSSTGSIIKNDILENYTSYITIEHEDDKRVINLLKDFDPVNAQVIDFGVNLLDFTDGVVSDEVYTVMIPLGAAMKDTEYDYFDGYSLTEDTAPDSSKQYYTHDTYTQATLKNVGTEDAPVYQFEEGVRYFEKVAKYTYTYAPWDSCNPNVTYYYNNKLREKKNLYYFVYGYQYFETDGNGNYWATGDSAPNWDKTYYCYEYSSASNLQHFSMWEDGDSSGYDYYTRKASEFFIATNDSAPVHGKTYYTSPSSVSYTACDVPLLKFEGTKSYFEYDGHVDESNNKLALSAGQFQTRIEDGYIKTGDKIIAMDVVKKYGLMTTTYENTDITTREDLEKYGLLALKATVSPVHSLEIKAIDLAMIKPDYEFVKIGQYIRARSKPHNLDSYFLCSKIDYDLNNPDNTTFTLGSTFDTLTGQQNKRIKSLNATINTVYEAAAKISDDAKANSIIAGQAQEKIDEANTKADDARTKAEEADAKADDAQTKAEEAGTKADEADAKAEEAARQAAENQKKVDEAKEQANTAIQNAKDAADAAAEAQKKADDATANATIAQDSATKAINAAKDAQTAADAAKSKADETYVAVGNVESQVGQINEEIVGIKQNATDLRDDLQGQIETVTNTMTADYAKKTDLTETTENLKSEITKSAAGITSSVEANYAKKTELATTTQIANDAKAAADANATDLTNAISKFNMDVNDLQGQIDGAIQTWFYEVPPTDDNLPAKDWTTTQLKNNHLGDLYYDTITGYCYRYQIQNNEYSWQRITDVDVTKALADAAAAQTIANHKRQVFVATPTPPYDIGDLWVQGDGGDIMCCQVAKTEQQTYAESDWIKASKYTDDSAVTNLSNIVETTYSTKSEVQQLSDKVSSTVSAVEEVKTNANAAQSTADEAKKNASAAQSTADEAKKNASTAQSTADEAKKNADEAQSAADAAKAAASTAQSKADEAAENLATAEKNLQDLKNQANATDEQLAAAETAVSNAKKAADDAATAAENASIAANAAQSTADEAKNAASEAQTTADTAKKTADDAQITATVAKQTADAAQEDIDDLKHRVSTAETNIEQNAEAITLRATKTEVTEAIDNVSVGGRNLYFGSKDFSGDLWVNKDSWTVESEKYKDFTVLSRSYQWMGVSQHIATKKGELYTISFFAKGTATSDLTSIHRNVALDNDTGLKIINGNFETYNYWWTPSSDATEWKRYWATLEVVADDVTLAWRLENSSTIGTVYICGLKLERGNKATDWTPAPEDVDADVLAKVDSIEIGGRNLLIDTSNSVIHTGTGSQNQTNFLYNFSDYYFAIPSVAEKEIVLSFEWETTATSGTFLIQLNADPWTQLSETITISSSNQSGKAVYITRANSGFDTGEYKGVQIRSDNLTGTVTVKNMMLEMGNKATSWQPAPEDMATIYTTKTEFTQTSEEIRMDFNKSIVLTSNNLKSQMDASDSAINTKLTEINKYIRFVDGKIVLGETGNELMLTIQNDRVSFTQAGVEVAYFSNNNLYIKEAKVLTNLRIGNYEWAPRNDGALVLRRF